MLPFLGVFKQHFESRILDIFIHTHIEKIMNELSCTQLKGDQHSFLVLSLSLVFVVFLDYLKQLKGD